jgi:hypothetical protein
VLDRPRGRLLTPKSPEFWTALQIMRDLTNGRSKAKKIPPVAWTGRAA